MEVLKKYLLNKEALLWTPLLLDVSLAVMTYPMFNNQRISAILNFAKASEQDQNKIRY